MILIGNQRGGAKNLANHLMSPANEHVTVHEIRGFSSDNLHSAFKEAYAMSRGTRCKQFLFSLSLNPPPQENVRIDVFESAIARIEEGLGLSGQPRAIVFHEKEARRHCHVVWSRIDTEKMKAVQLSFTHRKLMELSKEIHIENNWKMPRGLMTSELRNPRNFTLAEWQQAKRAGNNARDIKGAIKDCWAVSDTKEALAQVLKERGLVLAKGDRRGVIVLDHTGEPYSLSKWAGVRAKDVRARLGPQPDLPSVEDAKKQIAQEMGATLDRLQREQAEAAQKQEAKHRARIEALASRHSHDRQQQEETFTQRQEAERADRQARFNTGARGLWDRITGRRAEIERQNEMEALQAWQRDRAERDDLIFWQLEQRRTLQQEIETTRQPALQTQQELQQDAAYYQNLNPSVEDMRREFERVQQQVEQERGREPGLPSQEIEIER